MIEIRIHGRGGQGGVTLAKIIATARFLAGDSVQAFGLYAAERSGAPLQAFCRFDREPIENRNLIYEPDHVIVLDPTLVGPAISGGLKAGGWILINTPEPPAAFAAAFPANRLATVDATAVARDHELGTRSVPIVNTALAGAAGRLLELDLESIHKALEHLGFVGPNLTAATQAYQALREAAAARKPGAVARPPAVSTARSPGLISGAADPPAVRTGQWATEQPHRQQLIPPCNHVCPAGNDVQGFLHALARDEVDEALEILLRTTPFPAVCGRVCPAPCTESCNRIGLDGAVNVRQLERYAGDHGEVTVEPAPWRDSDVAVVGSGPAGLAAAWQLRRLGYGVRVYESGEELGGLLRTGIPAYRLPPEVLDREIGRILALGVEVETGRPVDRPVLFYLARSYDAVLVATGLQELRSLRLGTADADAVVQGIDFLDRARRGEVRVDGEDVVVVGGGNTAMDAARSALRLGAASVRVVYRRTLKEMPAIREEIDQAIEEGVEMDVLTLPVALRCKEPSISTGPEAKRGVRFPPLKKGGQGGFPRRSRGSAGTACRLVCRRMELGEPDASGRRRPVEVPGSDFELDCQRVILALGQSPDLAVFPEGTEVREGHELLGLLETPVFAVGDLATGDGTVAAAIGSGRRAALHIHEVLGGEPAETSEHAAARSPVDVRRDEVIRADAMKLHLFERRRPAGGATLAPRKRRSTFDEIHQGLADPREARRCLSCGVCDECDLCVTYCPEGVLKRVGHDFVFDYSFCKGCGVCAAECPRNVIFMSHL